MGDAFLPANLLAGFISSTCFKIITGFGKRKASASRSQAFNLLYRIAHFLIGYQQSPLIVYTVC